MNAADVLEALYPLLLKRGRPQYIRSDNGPEFIATGFQQWLVKVGIKPIQIYPGSPWENGYNERFNGTLRNEVLNAEWFHTTNRRKPRSMSGSDITVKSAPNTLSRCKHRCLNPYERKPKSVAQAQRGR